MNKATLLALTSLIATPSIAAGVSAPERIVFIRHGEKPKAGLGQLDCQGLNRALALPAYLSRAFGAPDAIFAPDPGKPKEDSGTLYDYVRPLITIEPTAIALGVPVDAHIGFDDVKGLEHALEAPSLRGHLVFVAWEHTIIEKVARELLATHGGEPSQVPSWDHSDFDGVDVVTIQDNLATFTHTQEGLDGLPTACPR